MHIAERVNLKNPCYVCGWKSVTVCLCVWLRVLDTPLQTERSSKDLTVHQTS